MNDALSQPMPFPALLSQSWSVLKSHLRTFLILPLIGYSAILAISSFMIYVIVPTPKSYPVNILEEWLNLSVGHKVGILFASLILIEITNRIHIAAIIAVREICTGRDHGPIKALFLVRRKHLRLPWFLALVSWFPPYVQGPVLALFFSPAYPVAVVEGLGARQALARSAALRKGGFAHIALLFLIYVCVLIAMTLIVIINGLGSRILVGIWIFLALLIGQWYMIGLTLNYYDQLRQHGEDPHHPGSPEPAVV